MTAPDTTTAMLEPLLAPLREDFFLRALAAVILGGVTCACLGAYVVLRRMAFVSTALTHSILPGIVGALLLGFSPYAGALAAALLTAGGTAWLAARRGTSEDSAIGVMLSVMFAAGIALMQQARSWRDFGGLLFGSVVSVGPEDLLAIGLTAAGSGKRSRFHPAMPGTTIWSGSSTTSGSMRIHQPPGPPRPRPKGGCTSPASADCAHP